MRPYIEPFEVAEWMKKHGGCRKLNVQAVVDFYKAGAIRELQQAKTFKEYEDAKAWFNAARAFEMYWYHWIKTDYVSIFD